MRRRGGGGRSSFARKGIKKSVCSFHTDPHLPSSLVTPFQKILLLCPLLKFSVKWRGVMALEFRVRVGVQAFWYDIPKSANFKLMPTVL